MHLPEFEPALHTGLRRGEEYAARWTDVNLERRLLTIPVDKPAEVSPGWVLGRPAWPDGESRRKWVTSTNAMEVDPADLNHETNATLQTYELML